MRPRVKVAITTPLACLIAWGMYTWKGHVIMPLTVVAMALSIGFCGMFVPSAFARIERFFFRFAKVVAMVLTWILLTPLFYLVFTPARLGMKLRGKDPMKRKCPSNESTYWRPRPPVNRKNYYRSQH